MENAVLYLHMKDFSLLGSVSKERIKNNEPANDRTINLFRTEVKSLRMNSVRNCNSFGLHRKTRRNERKLSFHYNPSARLAATSYLLR